MFVKVESLNRPALNIYWMKTFQSQVARWKKQTLELWWWEWWTWYASTASWWWAAWPCWCRAAWSGPCWWWAAWPCWCRAAWSWWMMMMTWCWIVGECDKHGACLWRSWEAAPQNIVPTFSKPGVALSLHCQSIMHRGVIWSSPDRYPIWFNSMFEFFR